MPGVPAIQLVLGLYTYKPTKKVLDEATALQTKSIEAQGAPGRQLLSDIDVYLAGINLWYSQNSPSTAPFTRTDIYALNALKSQFLGQGGGEEVANASFLDAARSKLGATRGDEAYEDLRGRYDPETATTTTRSFPDQTKVSVVQAARHGAHRQRQLPLDRAQAPGLDARAPRRGRPRSTIRTGRRSWPATSSSPAARRRRRARRSSWAARRSATTTPA